METKIQARYLDRGFGFPITLLNVPMIKVRGKWTPNIDYNVLAEEVLKYLAKLDGRLSGAQVRFIRQHFDMTLQQFAKRFALTHPAVLKWEKAGDKPTGMSWSTEKDIRLFITSQLETKPKDFQALYLHLETVTPERAAKVQLPAETLAA